ncbi:thiopurine s-methyltransferase family protein [Colletotrichum truncatum]|uniref:Thiopurine s-methyltransferase family protein n=1 Tax=Colletotrichum truncatum TaxID=5467 RepID=A0ACC3YFG5_COLTU|nr:thiopurine s-methyltransferase family protein [Colletotrichum truncatum]KAF6788312.1 thiopurine s-methyltransferase family protein [Colletotrichum truncatum]
MSISSHFANRPRDQQTAGWTELWDSNENHLWDRGGPSEALIDWLNSKPASLPVAEPGTKLRALVPGCGQGYDVAMLALNGFDVYGIEVSETGCKTARDYVNAELQNPRPSNFAVPESQNSSILGSARIIQGDFFSHDWEEACSGGGFDLIYDYTFLCALPPDFRVDWARRMGQLLSEKGVLVCLEFPLQKALDAPGPPWGLQGVYWDLLAEGGNGVLTNDEPKIKDKDRLFQRVAYFRPERSHSFDKGTDMMSVWTRYDSF